MIVPEIHGETLIEAQGIAERYRKRCIDLELAAQFQLQWKTNFERLEMAMRRDPNHVAASELAFLVHENITLRARITECAKLELKNQPLTNKIRCELNDEIEGYLDGAPDASEASKLANRISLILKPL